MTSKTVIHTRLLWKFHSFHFQFDLSAQTQFCKGLWVLFNVKNKKAHGSKVY